jgi:hypothetical protein
MLRLTVAGTTYEIPESGENPNWAQGLTDFLSAVTDVLATLVGDGDILKTTFTIANNISSATNINGLLFDSSLTRAANISYSIYRTSTATPSGNAETGTLYIIYDDSASSGNKWNLSQNKDGDAGVAFSITDLGQMQYKSSNINATGYSGTIVFTAKSLDA